MSQIQDTIKSKYAAVAESDLSNTDAGVRAIAQAFGYSAEDLTAIPAEANMGLSCGNPTAFAHLRPDETVVDLGCGGGLDVLLAARKVGATGRAIGIDMTPEMIDRARQNAARPVDGAVQRHIEFHLAPIDRLPLPGRPQRAGERTPQGGLPSRGRPDAPARTWLGVRQEGAIGAAVICIERGQRLAAFHHGPQQQALRLAVVGAMGVRRARRCGAGCGRRRSQPGRNGFAVVTHRLQQVSGGAAVVSEAAIQGNVRHCLSP